MGFYNLSHRVRHDTVCVPFAFLAFAFFAEGIFLHVGFFVIQNLV